ncbi:hypothetical protein E1B28_009270 [Marasmius oreades]|uniref:Uncharacterized protein n=1 Tax=Marasmius oreades TaxID=181124 RepID=A0A9P7S061_9AGAR|nr:uncharacterized protein E1B28_009270 [Marasmius oreades]KAG7092969.1 hypothetical protein E1B28_009270 [Marasmius oreades]
MHTLRIYRSKSLLILSSNVQSAFHLANMNSLQSENKTTSLSSTTKSLIKSTVHGLLEKRNIPFDTNSPIDQALYDDCKEIFESKFHFPLSHYPFFGTCLYIGVDLACSAFAHLPRCNQVHIAFFTAFHMALDDQYHQIHEQLEGFSERLVKGSAQDNPILAGLATILFDTNEYYGRLQSNLIVTSTLDFVASLMMDLEIQKMESLDSPSFAAYCRLLSGISVAFAMFIFPKDIEIAGYIQCLPHLNTYINGIKYDPFDPFGLAPLHPVSDDYHCAVTCFHFTKKNLRVTTRTL